MSDGHQRVMEMLSTALEMEEKGKKFYDRAVEECRNELGKEIFSMLREDEVVHMERIHQIYDSLKQGQSWPEEWASVQVKSRDTRSIFRKIAQKHALSKAEASDLEALNVGLEFEAASVEFYEGQLGKAQDPLERKFIELMVMEERGHHRILSDLHLYYSDPEQWFLEQEHAGLDGA